MNVLLIKSFVVGGMPRCSSSDRRGPKRSRGHRRDLFDFFGNDNKYA